MAFMNILKTYNRAFINAIIFTIVVTIAAAFIYSSLSKWQEKMVERHKLICHHYAEQLEDYALSDITVLGKVGLFDNDTLSSAELKMIDATLKNLSKEILKVRSGLEGGFYLPNMDEFYGYSFPTSPPPVPVYGPPPRSYNIIKTQSIRSIEGKLVITDLHAFDAAIFPLTTRPIILNSRVICVIWVRIHIENELPIIKLKQVVNIAAIISILGFIILMLFSSLLGGEIQGIKKEMENIRNSPSYRLRKRRGIFGYISSNINEMLSSIEEENNQRKILEQKLNQKEKLASLGTMVAGVAHEIKTPLSIIKTRIQMWQKEIQKNPELTESISSESLQMVINETNRLSTLVKRLLIFSRPIEKNMKEADITKLIQEVVNFINMDRDNSNIPINIVSSRDIPMVQIDENSIKQVVLNVLDNSLDSIEGGGKIIINSNVDQDNKMVIVDITDTGKGIPQEMKNKIFDPFFTLKDKGVGLGLSISYQIIKAHNGEIYFEDSECSGTRCIIKLPLYNKKDA